MTDQLIAVAKIKDIFYEDPKLNIVNHIGCGKIDKISHKHACGIVTDSLFESIEIENEEFACLGCIVATQNLPDDICWHDGLKCVCDSIQDVNL